MEEVRMFKKIGKRALSFLLAAAMVFTLLPVMPLVSLLPEVTKEQTVQAKANAELLNGDVYVTIDGGGTTSGVSATGMTITAEGGLFGRETLTIYIDNKTSEEMNLSFDYSLTGNYETFKIASATAAVTGSYSAKVPAEKNPFEI
jgi:hypothetical protein